MAPGDAGLLLRLLDADEFPNLTHGRGLILAHRVAGAPGLICKHPEMGRSKAWILIATPEVAYGSAPASNG